MPPAHGGSCSQDRRPAPRARARRASASYARCGAGSISSATLVGAAHQADAVDAGLESQVGIEPRHGVPGHHVVDPNMVGREISRTERRTLDTRAPVVAGALALVRERSDPSED